MDKLTRIINNPWSITIIGGLIILLLVWSIKWLIKYFKEKRVKQSGKYVASNIVNKKITFYLSESSNNFENKIFRDLSVFLQNQGIILYKNDIDSQNFKNESLKIFGQNSRPSIKIQFRTNPDELIIGYDEEKFQKSFDDYFVSFKKANIQEMIEELKNRKIIYFRWWTAGEYDVIDGKIHTTVLHNFVDYLKSSFQIEPSISPLKEENLNLFRKNTDPSNHPKLLITLNGKTEFETIYFLNEIDKIQNYFGLLFLEFKKAQPEWFKKTTKE